MKERAFGSMVASTVASLFVMSAAHAGDAHAPADKAAKADAKAPYCRAEQKLTSACKGHGNANCAKQNEAGKGFLEAKDEGACKKAGGKWMPHG